MLTPEQCAEIKARWAAATQGPWMCPSEEPRALVAVADPRVSLLTVDDGFALVYEQTDATAIAAAPADVAALLATVEALRAELAEAVGLMGRAVKYATEDRAVTPRSTRLARLLVEVSTFLARHGGA